FGADPRRLGAQQLLGPHDLGFGFGLGAHRLDFALLPGLSLRAAASQFEDGFARLDVLALDFLLLVAAVLVGADVLLGGQLGDLADALCVEDVVGSSWARGVCSRWSIGPSSRM